MPQKRHCRFRLRFNAIRSLSGPVDVMTPLAEEVVVVATSDAEESDVDEPLLFVELQPPVRPEVGDGVALGLDEFPLLLVLLRDALLLALALMRRLRSSLRSDFSGETCMADERKRETRMRSSDNCEPRRAKKCKSGKSAVVISAEPTKKTHRTGEREETLDSSTDLN